MLYRSQTGNLMKVMTIGSEEPWNLQLRLPAGASVRRIPEPLWDLVAMVLQTYEHSVKETDPPSRGHRSDGLTVRPVDCPDFWLIASARDALIQVLRGFWQRSYNIDCDTPGARDYLGRHILSAEPVTPIHTVGLDHSHVLTYRNDLDSTAAAVHHHREHSGPLVLVTLGVNQTLYAHEASLQEPLRHLFGTEMPSLVAATFSRGQRQLDANNPIWVLLHTVIASAVSLSLGCDRVLYPENGVSNLQLPITVKALAQPANRAVHPGVTEALGELIALMTGESFTICNPLLRKTPSDIVELIVAQSKSNEPVATGWSNRSAGHAVLHHTLAPATQLDQQYIERHIDHCIAILSQSGAESSAPSVHNSRVLIPFIIPGNPGILDTYIQRIRTLPQLSDSALFRRWFNLPGVRWHTQRQEGTQVLKLMLRHIDTVRNTLAVLLRRYANDVITGMLPATCLLMRAISPSGSANDQKPTQQPTFRLHGERWVVWYGDGEPVYFNDRLGMRYIRVLLENPCRNYFVTELRASAIGGETLVTNDTRLLDSTAISAFKSRIMQLERELQVANDNNDLGRATQVDQELHLIRDELKNSVGRSGAGRLHGMNENMRRAISNAIHRCLRDIKKHNQALASHLRSSLHIGMFLSYEPREEIYWLT
ncbi:MAG: hypothetical protein AAGC55_07585 [Myxococcota bacterium]